MGGMRQKFGRVLAASIVLALPGPLAAADSRPGHDAAAAFIGRYGATASIEPELAPIADLLRRERPADAILLCDALIARPQAAFRSAPEANWLWSEAYRYRAIAAYARDGDVAGVLTRLKPAANLGNFKAIKIITESILRKLGGDPDYAAVEANVADLGRYLRIAAELGHAPSALLLGAANSPVALAEPEKIYWSLLGFALAINDDLAYRRKMMAGIVSHYGRDRVMAAIATYSLVSPIAAGPGPLPGRGLMASLYVDANLRREYGSSYGRRGSEGPSARATPSTIETFRGEFVPIAAAIGEVDAYLVVPGSRPFADRALIAVPRPAVDGVLGPGDSVFVRCGPLAHLATIHHVDRRTREVFFVDGLWQFWQPSHNSCITRFRLVPYRSGGFLAAVGLDEFEATVEAIATLRDRPAG